VDSDPNQQSPGWNREPTAELVTSRSGRIVTANDRTEALLRCPARHIVGKPILVFIASEERRGFVHSYARLRRRDSHATAEWLVNIKPCFDEAVPVVLRARPLRSADGELLQVAMSLFTHGNRVRDRLADSSLLR
jgi:PAS domain-containing protein